MNRTVSFGFLFTIGTLLFTGIINAQTDFKPGYVITNTNDTLYGEIDYRRDLIMSETCKFRNAQNEIKPYTPYDILGYRFIDSKYFITKEIDHQKVFMEYLIKGEVNIYYMRDHNGSYYYIDKDNEKLTEITYVENIIKVDNKKVFYESTRHFGILFYYMQDAPEFRSRIESMKKPNHNNLINLAEDYHNAVCEENEECVIYEKKLPLIKISVESFAGMVRYNGGYSTNEWGGYIYLWAPSANKGLSLRTGFTHHEIIEEGTEVKIRKIPVQIQYIYNAHRIQPKISIGTSILTIKYDTYKYYTNTYILNTGLDFKISKIIKLSTCFNSDFNSQVQALMRGEESYFISYSLTAGIRFDL